MGWLEVRASILDEMTIASEALPSLAMSSAGENELAAQFNLMSGLLTLLGSDFGRNARQWRKIMRHLCKVLLFDSDVNVQVLEASYTSPLQARDSLELLYCRSRCTRHDMPLYT